VAAAVAAEFMTNGESHFKKARPASAQQQPPAAAAADAAPPRQTPQQQKWQKQQRKPKPPPRPAPAPQQPLAPAEVVTAAEGLDALEAEREELRRLLHMQRSVKEGAPQPVGRCCLNRGLADVLHSCLKDRARALVSPACPCSAKARDCCCGLSCVRLLRRC
jgi:hypothetical protein